jgi:uncharacterized protein
MIVQRNLAALLTGLIFGIGLATAQMIDPNKILNFLDLAGTWDASLLFVLGGAVVTSFFAFRFILKQQSPVFATKFSLPVTTNIDRSLLLGAALFGVGWGLAGYCPGPGFAALTIGSWEPIVFVATMIIGFLLHRIWAGYAAGGKRVSSQSTIA